MPPKEKLPDSDVATLTRWVQLGAPWPAGAETAIKTGPRFQITDEQRRFWAFQPLRSTVPAVSNAAWPRSDIDRFVLAGLEAKGLAPAIPAEKRTLIRRATFDLIGLPPTPEEIDAFSPTIRPTRSPGSSIACSLRRTTASAGAATGSTWSATPTASTIASSAGRRTSTTSGATAIGSWTAFNRDLPYDQFVQMQIAGDLLPAGSDAERYATASSPPGCWPSAAGAAARPTRKR